jgi:hypothetical protein
MRISMTFLVLTLFAPATLVAQEPTPMPERTVDWSLDRAIAYLASQLNAVAEAMPEEYYDTTPHHGTFTFGQQIKHVAINNYLSGAIVSGRLEPLEANAAHITGKSAIVAYLRESYEYLRAAIAPITLDTVLEPVQSGGSMIPRLNAVIGPIAHGWNHYGQTTQYLRSMRIVPPASR